jgi:hypothetical protein
VGADAEGRRREYSLTKRINTMTERKEPVELTREEMRGLDTTYRSEPGKEPFAVWLFNMPPNEKSEALNEGDEVMYNGGLFRVYIKLDRCPPSVSQRLIQFWLVRG